LPYNRSEKLEYRNPKSETNSNIEILNKIRSVVLWFRISSFEFVSDFDIRISDLVNG